MDDTTTEPQWLLGTEPSERDSEPRYSHVLQAVVDTPWAILPAKFAAIRDLLALRATGVRLTADEIQQHIGAAPTGGGARSVGSVAVLPLRGTLIPRADLMTEMSGGTSLERWTAAFRQAVADPGVSAIVLDVDSPGGSVFGVQEAADVVYKARGGKPVAAVANSLMASAAYWIGVAADELVVTPSGEVGSIGVFGAHEDMSQALQQAGVTVSLISAGKFKTEGNPFEPLSADARDAMQSRVNDYYQAFTQAVARGRNTNVAAVRAGFGEGRVVGARQAVTLGMADAVGTLDETINRLARGKRIGSHAESLTRFEALTEDTLTEAEASELDAILASAPAWPSLDLRRRRLRRRAIA